MKAGVVEGLDRRRNRTARPGSTGRRSRIRRSRRARQSSSSRHATCQTRGHRRSISSSANSGRDVPVLRNETVLAHESLNSSSPIGPVPCNLSATIRIYSWDRPIDGAGPLTTKEGCHDGFQHRGPLRVRCRLGSGPDGPLVRGAELHVRGARPPRQPARPRADERSASDADEHVGLFGLQQHRVHGGDAGLLQDPGGPSQHQLPLRRRGARVPPGERRRHDACLRRGASGRRYRPSNPDRPSSDRWWCARTVTSRMMQLTDWLRYEDLVESGEPERDFGPRSSDDRYILYTGGTTGLPARRRLAPGGHLLRDTRRRKSGRSADHSTRADRRDRPFEPRKPGDDRFSRPMIRGRTSSSRWPSVRWCMPAGSGPHSAPPLGR